MTTDLKTVLDKCRDNPTRAFIPGSCTRSQVLSLAASIYSLKKETLCLCTADKTLVAAALLSAAYGGPDLILPYSFSSQALLDACKSTPFSSILSDASEHTIPGVEVITPDMLTSDCHLPDTPCSQDKQIARIFTGGSTGKPKIWPKTLHNLFGEAAFLSAMFNIKPDDIIASTVPPQHIYGLLFSTLMPLISNCSVLEPMYTLPQEILSAVHKHGTTVLVSVPAQYHALKTSGLRQHALRIAFSSAGLLNTKAACFFHTATGINITEIFGSTETGGIAWRQSPSDGQSWRPFKNVQWKIQKQHLLVCSDFLSPELPRNKDGFFTTSDHIEPSPGGSFSLHGRCDDIVKVGGKRVDLADVCAKIRQINGVTDVVVFALPTDRSRGCDVAALVAGKIDVQSLRLHLSANCESYACPRHIKIVDTIPVMTTGKHDPEIIKQFFSN